MKNKIIKFVGVTLFSSAVLLLLGSVPNAQKNAEVVTIKELSNINNASASILPKDFDQITKKNPSILLEISVE